MSDEINDKNDDGTNVANAVSPSGEIEVLDIKRADSSSGRNGGKGGRNGGRREYKPFPGWLYGVLFVVFDTPLPLRESFSRPAQTISSFRFCAR